MENQGSSNRDNPKRKSSNFLEYPDIDFHRIKFKDPRSSKCIHQSVTPSLSLSRDPAVLAMTTTVTVVSMEMCVQNLYLRAKSGLPGIREKLSLNYEPLKEALRESFPPSPPRVDHPFVSTTPSNHRLLFLPFFSPFSP